MKFIIDNDETKRALLEQNANVSIITFFFWNSGTKMQRCITGMLCSLLHQMLRANRTNATMLLKDEPILSSKESILDWSINELQQAILKILPNRAYSYCLFIDGLDEVEYSEGQAGLLQVLEKFRRQPNVKLCVSSRPESTLLESLKIYPKLKLQDLTKGDIRQYVADVLGPLEDAMVKSGKLESKSRLINIISNNADGVFLWAKLVVKSLQRGTTYEDNWDTLMKRMNLLPREIDRLYNHMWSRLNEDQELYRSEAAYYFKFVLHTMKHRTKSLSLVELMVASEKSLNDQVLDEESADLVQLCKVVEKRLAIRCAGLLEVTKFDYDTSSETTSGSEQDATLSELKRLSRKTRITFIHRSAQEFLCETETGRQILGHCNRPVEELWSDLIRATIIGEILSRPTAELGNEQYIHGDEGSSHPEIIMHGLAAAKSDISEQMEFKLLDFYGKTLQQNFGTIKTSMAFLCLAARFGHYTYVRHYIEQIESRCGSIGTEVKTRLLYSAASWRDIYAKFSIFIWILGKSTNTTAPGKNQLISWLLEDGADPNLTIVRRNGECDTVFSSAWKNYFNVMKTHPSRRLSYYITVGLQRIFDLAGDVRRITLFYHCKEDYWEWDTEDPRSFCLNINDFPDWVVVVQVNCSWLTRTTIAQHRLEVGPSKDGDQALTLRCDDDVKPELKVLEVFSENTRLAELGLAEYLTKDPKNLLVLLVSHVQHRP